MKKQAGFTLVEIAIVLVVIGLLLGGVLKGQELLENGRIRKALNDFNTIAAATFTYQDRYREFPGDDDGADRFTGGVSASGSEAGDGIIDGDWNAEDADVEAALFWSHLRLDNLVEGAGTARPANAFNGETGVMFENFGITEEHVIVMDNVNVKAAVIMDSRIDDGDTTTGSFRVLKDDDCVNAEADDYSVNEPGRGCITREL